MDRKIGRSSSRARPSASGPQGCQSTGLCACWRRYGLVSPARRLVCRGGGSVRRVPAATCPNSSVPFPHGVLRSRVRRPRPRGPCPPLGVGSLVHSYRAILVALLTALVGVSVWAAPVAAAQPVPKVALVVGPVGSITPAYRALANEAADAARAAGAEVVKVYSPDATWTAVKRALDGASIVVYLGHGNGWPSRYRDAL